MKFGDLIAYSRGLYTHYAVYTGKKDGQDMAVEFTGEKGLNSKAGASVKEGPLKPGGIVEQYMTTLPVKSEEEMKESIRKLLRDGAGKYGVLDNNCEHLATGIIFGKPMSQQAEAVLNTQVNFNNEIADTFGVPFYPPLYKQT